MTEIAGDEVFDTLEHFMNKVENPTVAIGVGPEGFIAAAAWKIEVDGGFVVVGAEPSPESNKGFPSIQEALMDLFTRLDKPPRDMSTLLGL